MIAHRWVAGRCKNRSTGFRFREWGLAEDLQVLVLGVAFRVRVWDFDCGIQVWGFWFGVSGFTFSLGIRDSGLGFDHSNGGGRGSDFGCRVGG